MSPVARARERHHEHTIADASSPTHHRRRTIADASSPTHRRRRTIADASSPTHHRRRIIADAPANGDFRLELAICLDGSKARRQLGFKARFPTVEVGELKEIVKGFQDDGLW
jgi:hypothetical protein